MQVLQPQLGRVHVQLAREAVDHPLDEVDGLGDAERAGVRNAAGRLVRVHARDVAVRRLDVVGAGEDAEEAGRVLGRLRRGVERAVVGEHVDPDRQDLAVLRRRDLALHDVVAGEPGRHQVLGAVLHPLDRLAGDDRADDCAHVAGVDRAPCCRSRRRCRARSRGSCARAARRRARTPCGARAAPGSCTRALSLPLTLFVVGDGAARLHRRRVRARVEHVLGDHDLGARRRPPRSRRCRPTPSRRCGCRSCPRCRRGSPARRDRAPCARRRPRASGSYSTSISSSASRAE